ncbi:phage tail protein, partial [Actinobacillus porcinus]
NVGVKMLYSQNDQGDTNPTSVTLRISVGDQHYDYHIHGKYSSQYLEKFEVANLPPVPFNIRVERITADSEKQRLQNGTIWTSYTEIIDTDFTYPNTAVFGVSFDSDYFNGVPTRNYLLKGIKVKVPSNYNPETRAYNGLWDGTFKIAWTDNPAWVLYDIITNKRYGLGGLIGEFGCDKWTLYDIARYCDVMVDDGFGGKEPRFTCNAWITDIDDAYKVINNICSIFRAIPVWTGTEFSAIIDRPADPSWTYTNANVKDGKFERTYSAKKSRHNAVKVTYSDKNNGYQKAVEYVSDDESIAKNGLNLTEVTAFGCTSRGQAYRTGRWLIETEKLEKETITFTVGREGLMHLPGDIIRVNDNDYAGANVGGRVLAVNGNKITLDREITLSGNSFLTYINKSAKESTLRITAVNGTIATLASTPSDIEPYTVWALTTEQIKSGLYKAMTLTENDDGTFTVTALQHEPQKEAIVDKSAHFVPTNKTAYRAPQIQDVDTKVGYDGKLYVTADIGSGDGEVTFDVRIVKDGKLYEYRQGLSNPNLALENLPNGEYTVIIYAKNKAGQVTSEKASHFTINKPPAPTGVNVSGGLGAITIEWDWVDDVTYTEIFASEDEHFANASKIAKVLSRSHVHSVGAEQIRYYWLRHVRGVNNGPFYQEQGIKGESAVDLDKKLEKLNKELSKNIIDEVIDTALPARKLEMIKTVERLETPTENLGHHQIYNEEDGKLYVWDGNKYTAKVQAVDLEGQLASSQLDQTLIDQLNRADSTASSAALEAGKVKNSLAQEITNRQNAIKAEIANRQNAIKAESASLTKKIQDEANARGTAINQLQNVDAQQAQQITTLTAKADNALSGITAEQKARADGDKANADKLTALTSRVGSAESSITTLQTSVATANRSVSELSQNLNAKIDGISVGGRNLLRDSEFNLYNKWGKPQIDFAKNANRRTIKVISTSDRNPVGICSFSSNFTSYFQQGETYTLSLFARGNVALDYIYLMRQDGNNVNLAKINITSETEFNYYKLTFKSPFTTQQGYFLVGFRHTSSGRFVEFHSLKLEKGNVATDWTPAPEDIESSVNAVSADLTSYKQTQANVDKAQTDQITAHTARLGSAEASLTSTSRTVATLDGKVQSLHTIQAVAISGGKKAIAGISMGASGSEGSVIVMADKFNVVKNAQDGNVKPMFGVVNNKVAVNGDLIADGAISARMMAANAVQAGTIQAGAINANHIQAGQISADKLAIGLGGNLLQNPLFANNAYAWTRYEATTTGVNANNGVAINRETGAYQGNEYLPTENQYRWQPSFSTYPTTEVRFAGIYQDVKLVANTWYILSCYVASTGGFVVPHVETKDGLLTHHITRNYKRDGIANYEGGLKDTDRIWMKFKAATNGTARCIFNQYIFANQTSPPFFVLRRPMLEECTEYTKEPSPWQNSGVTAIHGGSIVTNTITAQQIMAGTITANELAANSVTTQKIATDSINASHITSKAISADKLNVNSLSAISANLGSVTAGSININNKFKVSNTGVVEMRSDGGNVGMVVNNDVIIVYDQNSKVRVKLGKLS